MKIAFLSYEYPPETGGGGIGTYLVQCVKWLPKFNHQPVVFCGTNQDVAFWENEYVYRIPCQKETYNQELVHHFREINSQIMFDVIEGTEFCAWGLSILKSFPDIPFCVKAHSANYLVDIHLYNPLSLKEKLRFIVGGILRFQIPKLPQPPQEKNYLSEKEIIQKADLVISPSHSLADVYQKMGWTNEFEIVPLPFFRNFEIKENNHSKTTILFLGRLERRKGVLDLVAAIPHIIKKHPDVFFKFVGTPANSPKKNILMDQYIHQKLNKYKDYYSIASAVPNTAIDSLFSQSDILIFPSLYDNFPVVCLEGMSSGKAVIGSSSGGMVEMIEENISGLLVKPQSPNEIVEKINLLIENKELRLSIGKNAQKRVLEKYHPEVIIPLQIKAYEKTIENNRKKISNQ